MIRDFIIIEPDPIVVMDVEGTLKSRFDTCLIQSGSSLQDVLAAIQECGPRTTILVRSTLISANNDFARALRVCAARGSHIIVFGETNDGAFPFTVLEVPFTTQTLNAVLDDSVSGNKSVLQQGTT